jgi:hypothetical protein
MGRIYADSVAREATFLERSVLFLERSFSLFRGYASAMQTDSKPRIPSPWLLLRPGEMMHSKLPLHRLELLAVQMGERGISVALKPSPQGYFVECLSRSEDQA